MDRYLLKNSVQVYFNDFMFYHLHKLGIRGKCLRVIMRLYKNMKSRVRIGQNLSEQYDVKVGVAQGDPLSSYLFSSVSERMCPLQLRRPRKPFRKFESLGRTLSPGCACDSDGLSVKSRILCAMCSQIFSVPSIIFGTLASRLSDL